MNIYQRINKVMQAVTYVQKDAAVSGAGGGYKAVTHDQVVSIARRHFVENGIVVYPEQTTAEMPIVRDLKQDIKMHLYSGTYKINFVNMDDPQDRIVVEINAQANDNGDKAPGKCVTYATKSAILKVLCLETGENDESREEVRERSKTVTPDQLSKLSEFCYTEGDNGVQWTPIGSKLAMAYRIQSLDQLPAAKFEEAMARCKKAAEAK